MFGRLSQVARNFATTAARQSHGPDRAGVAGSSFPFDITNRYKLTAYFVLFFGSGLGIPFLMVRHQLLKK